MADVFLIIATIVLSVLLIFSSFYLLVLYCHPEDNGWGTSLFCKIIVIAGMTLSWAQVLVLPLDVANSRGYGGGLDIQTLWYIIYVCIAILVSILIPFAQFMYETDDEKSIGSRICTAVIHQIVFFLVVAALFFIAYSVWRYVDIPVVLLTSSTFTASTATNNVSQSSTDSTLEISASFIIFIIAFISFIGNCFFTLFVGVGLYALPLDMINDFINRPVLRKSSEAMEIKQTIKRGTESLIEQGKKVKCKAEIGDEIDESASYFNRRSQLKKFDAEFNTFRINSLYLERDYDIFKLELSIASTNPLIWVLKLILGIVLFIISFIWWLHIIIYVLAPGWNGYSTKPFLNSLLIGLEESSANFIGTAVFAFLSLYLLWCVQKGNAKFGVRIPFLFTVHPMKENETWMNSFLFNTNLVLLCSVAICQFCTKAFSQYTRLTQIDILFNTQIRYMRFFAYFYKNNVFEYVIIIWSALTCVYLIIKRSDKPKALKQIEELRQIKVK